MQQIRHSWLSRIELSIGIISIAAILLLLIVNIFVPYIPDFSKLMGNLIFPIIFFGASLASKFNDELSLNLPFIQGDKYLKPAIEPLKIFFSTAINFWLFIATLAAIINISADSVALGIPIVIFQIFVPVGFILLTIRSLRLNQSSISKPFAWILFVSGLLVGVLLSFGDILILLSQINPANLESENFKLSAQAWIQTLDFIKTPLIIIILLSTFIGLPIHLVLGGILCLLLSHTDDFSNLGIISASQISNAFTKITEMESLRAIVLFALLGFILTFSKAGERLVRFFNALFGRFQGGAIIGIVVLSAFFTIITGASGITIIALGSLFLIILMKDQPGRQSFSIGFITSLGSIGVLFPPSLAIIIYASTANKAIPDFFLGGLLPGLLFLVGMIVGGLILSRRLELKKEKIDIEKPKLGASFLAALPELLIFVLTFVLYFIYPKIEPIAAIMVVYAFVLEVLIRKEISMKQLGEVFLRTLIILGGIFIILAIAQGLAGYFTDNDLPQQLAEWVRANIQSRELFTVLLVLSLFIIGCFIDLYSAIIIVYPLVSLLGDKFGFNPIHFGILILSALEVGRILPPLGLNLFLASYRFNRPLQTVYKDVLPFILIQIIVVFIIAFIPWLSTAFLNT